MNSSTPSSEPETVEVEDLDQFVKLLVAWHAKKVATVKHMMAIPEGTQVSDDEGTTDFPLEGDALTGFKLGIFTALSELGTLPFNYELEPEASAA